MNRIFLPKFRDLAAAAGNSLGQCGREWGAFLEFAAGYFELRDIQRPVVVEIGVWRNTQKRFYRELLGAYHIGIDIDRRTKADIVGDSQSPATVEKLKALLSGHPIDLLFIDGHHSYAGVKGDYELYAPMTRHLVAIHDLVCTTHREVHVKEFWDELKAGDKENLFILFHKPRAHERGTCWDGQEMGIGVVVKE